MRTLAPRYPKTRNLIATERLLSYFLPGSGAMDLAVRRGVFAVSCPPGNFQVSRRLFDVVVAGRAEQALRQKTHPAFSRKEQGKLLLLLLGNWHTGTGILSTRVIIIILLGNLSNESRLGSLRCVQRGEVGPSAPRFVCDVWCLMPVGARSTIHSLRSRALDDAWGFLSSAKATGSRNRMVVGRARNRYISVENFHSVSCVRLAVGIRVVSLCVLVGSQK